jgi:hypothetical protein
MHFTNSESSQYSLKEIYSNTLSQKSDYHTIIRSYIHKLTPTKRFESEINIWVVGVCVGWSPLSVTKQL